MRINTGIASPMRYFQTLKLGGVQNYYGATSYMYSGYSLSLTGGLIYQLPFFFGRRFVLKQYGVVISTFTTAGPISLGLYSDNLRRPYKLIKGSEYENITVSGTGFVSRTLTVPLILQKGRMYWAALHMGGGSFVAKCGWWGIAPLLAMDYWNWTTYMPHGGNNPQSWQTTLPLDVSALGFGYLQYVPMIFMREPNEDGT